MASPVSMSNNFEDTPVLPCTLDQFFQEVNPLNSARTPQELICDFAIICLIQFGEKIEQYYQNRLQSMKISAEAKSLEKSENSSELSNDTTFRVEFAKIEGIRKYFKEIVQRQIDAREKSMEEFYGKDGLLAFKQRFFGLPSITLQQNILIDNTPHKLRDILGIITVDSGFIFSPPTLAHMRREEIRISSLIFPLLQTMMGNGLMNAASLQIMTGNDLTAMKAASVPAQKIGLFFCPEGFDKGLVTLLPPISYKYSMVDNHPLEVESSIESESLPISEPTAEDKDIYDSRTFLMTMATCLVVERRIKMREEVLRILNQVSPVFKNLIEDIVGRVPPPKYTIEITEE